MTPIITRLYEPKEFGIGEIFVIISALLTIVATLRLEQIFVLPKDDDEAKDLFVTVLNIIVLITIIISIILFCTYFIFETQLPKISSYFLFLPVSIICVSVYESSLNLHIRFKNYKHIAIYKVVYHAGIAIGRIILGYMGFGVEGLILGTLVGYIVGATLILIGTLIKFQVSLKVVALSRIKKVIKEYDEFPKINLVQQLLLQGKENFISFFISGFWGGRELGFYALTLKILKTPIYLFGSSVATVFYQQMSEKNNDGEFLYPMVKKFILKYAMIAVIPFLTLYFFAPTLFTMVFGAKWQAVGPYVQVLCPWFYCSFVLLCSEVICMVIKVQKRAFKISVGFDIGSLVIFAGSALSGAEFITSLLCFSLFASLGKIVFLFWFLKALKNHGLEKIEQESKI
jgi:O-antigen/teichoic acid export membrane protein